MFHFSRCQDLHFLLFWGIRYFMCDFSFIPCCNFQQRIRFLHFIIPGIGFIEYCLLSWLQVYSRKWKGFTWLFLWYLILEIHSLSYSTRTKDLDSNRKFWCPYSNILDISEGISKYFFSFDHFNIWQLLHRIWKL